MYITLLLVFTIFLLSSDLYISLQLNVLGDRIEEERLIPELKEQRELENKIKEVKEDLNKIFQIEENQPKWSNFLKNISVLAPEEIKLASFKSDVNSKDIKITGFAPTREIFISFEKALREDPKIIDVVSPISNILKEKNIDFSLTLKIK